MTRINLIDPSTISTRHLLAEYRELPRIFSLVQKRLQSEKGFDDIPNDFRLGPGHVKFFYNKLRFLEKRFHLLIDEMDRRGYTVNFREIPPVAVPESLWNDWKPTPEDLKISKERILERS